MYLKGNSLLKWCNTIMCHSLIHTYQQCFCCLSWGSVSCRSMGISMHWEQFCHIIKILWGIKFLTPFWYFFVQFYLLSKSNSRRLVPLQMKACAGNEILCVNNHISTIQNHNLFPPKSQWSSNPINSDKYGHFFLSRTWNETSMHTVNRRYTFLGEECKN